MLTHLETLAVLAEAGTMTRAATQLRISQSAVSKRIAALEEQVGRELVEAVGRKVRLTPFGIHLLERTAPHLSALKEAVLEEAAPQSGRLIIGVSESVLASWGALLLARVGAAMPRLDLVVNAHRSPVAVERVRSGEYMLALVAGVSDDAPDLKAEKLLEEEMVVVPANLERLRLGEEAVLPVIAIEPAAATWVCLERRLRNVRRRWGFAIEVARTLQSFACIVQLARYGAGHGLVPVGVARAMGVGRDEWVGFPEPGLSRPVSLVGRSTTLAQPLAREFGERLREGREVVAEFVG